MPTGPDKDRLLSNERTSAAALLACLTFAALLVCFTILGCAPPHGEPIGEVEPEPPPEVDPGALGGENLGGSNLGGVNLGGANLGGANLGGANLGGSNLGGSNVAAGNLGGTNLGGNNLGGSNLGGSNLGGVNLAGKNLGGVNLGGVNLAGSNLGGSNVAGTNLAGNPLNATNLAGAGGLAGSNTARNIHNLAGATNGMLYSGEDMWTPKTAQCVVMGIGSAAFARLLGQQSAGARISVALGKLPWGFATTKGGPMALRAWEAVVWGDRTYCVFVLAAPPAASWPGVAGFIKAIFRWQAPPTQLMDISGIEASAAQDLTLGTTVVTHAGMMNAGALWRAGTLGDTAAVAGELAFISATTNNQAVLVDFSSWVQDRNKNPIVLGQVQAQNPPTYAEALYIALDNGDGTVSIMLDDAASRTKVMPTGMTNSVVDLNSAYLAYQAGVATKPIPRRCGGALFLNTWFGEPVPEGKCDAGLTWAPGFCIRGSGPWSSLGGTTAPMNGYMQLTQNGGAYKRGLVADNSCGPMKTVLSETYIHMWERNYDLPVSGSCTAESRVAFCARLGKTCGSVTGTDNCGQIRTEASCGACAGAETCGGAGLPNVCGASTSKAYEGEALASTLAGSTATSICPEAYNKVIGGRDPGAVAGACSGGAKIRFIGKGSSNYVAINDVEVPAAGNYTLTIFGYSNEPRTFSLSVNGGAASAVGLQGPDWITPVSVSRTVALRAGRNTVKLFNDSAAAPDLDRVVVSGGSTAACTPEPDLAFCARLAKNCGAVTAPDNCGVTRTVASCGLCTSPLTCGGGGTTNVCGGSASGTCAVRYAQASCLSYFGTFKVSSGGKNWICVNDNCKNCATFASCAPGVTGCPWGVVWSDAGACR
jgi:hypothetical protein